MLLFDTILTISILGFGCLLFGIPGLIIASYLTTIYMVLIIASPKVYKDKITGVKYIYDGIHLHTKYDFVHVLYEKNNPRNIKMVSINTPLELDYTRVLF